MPDWLATLVTLLGSAAAGYLLGKQARKRTHRLSAPKREPGEPVLARKPEIALAMVSPHSVGHVNLHLSCDLCGIRWQHVDVLITDNVWLTCPRCGARETSDDVRAALREDLRQAASDPPPGQIVVKIP